MEKKIIEEPIYDTIQVGVNKKEIWITSDGIEHEKEGYAESHEFYQCKVKQRGFGFPYTETVLDLFCIEDLERYEKDYTYNVSHFDYDKNKLTFPKTYVLVEEHEEEDDDSYGYPDVHLKIYTVDEYKSLINKLLEKINPI